MPKPPPWMLVGAALGIGLAGCHKRAAEAEAKPERPSSVGLKVEAYKPPIAKAPLGKKLETAAPHPGASGADAVTSDVSPAQAATEAPAVRAPIPGLSTRAPAAPRVGEPSRDLYADADLLPPPPPDPPGFRLTVPLCRRAARMDDPLARTEECARLIEAARAQADACREAFEDGDDEVAMSPACRQAAGFR